MRSFIKSHKRIGSFGKDDKDKKENSTRPSPSTASANYSNPVTRPSEIKKQPSFEVLSTNNPNVHPGFTYSTTPIGSPQVANPITPVLKNNELPLTNPFTHSPKMGHDEFYGSTPSSPKTLFKQYSFPLENPPVNSKKKILKYPKNLFSRSSNNNLRESARETHDSTHTNYTNNSITTAKHQQWTGATNSGPVAGISGLNSPSGCFGDEEDEFYFRDYNQDMTSPTVRANSEPKVTQNTGVGLDSNAHIETNPICYNHSATSSHSTNKDTVSGESFASFQGFPRKSLSHSDIPIEKEDIPARKSPYLSKEEWERKLNVPSHTLQPELDDFKHRVRNFNPTKSPVIYEEARNKSLQKLLGQEANNESSSVSIKDCSSTNELQSQISSYSHVDEVLVLHVRPKSPTSPSEGIKNAVDDDDDNGVYDPKRDSVDSSKSNSKRDSLKNVIDKVKNYKRKSGGSEKNRSSIASVVEDHRASVIQINTDKRASILKKLKKHDSANRIKKKVSIKESVTSSNIIAEEEEERSAGSEQTSLTDSNSLTFSFERDLINGRNVSIRYYKSISERDREKANNPQSLQGLYVDDFNADEYGEEDFNEDMNYYDDEEADDTEHLFNRQLFSDDENAEQDDGMYDDLMDGVNVDDNDENELDDYKAEHDDDKAELINGESELDKNAHEDVSPDLSDNASDVLIEELKCGLNKSDNIETETSENDNIKMEFDINALLSSIESHSNNASQPNIVSKTADDSLKTLNTYNSAEGDSQKVLEDNSNELPTLPRLGEEAININNELAKELAELKVHKSKNLSPTHNEVKISAVNNNKEFISEKEETSTMSSKVGSHSKNSPFSEASNVKTSHVGTVNYPKTPIKIDDSTATIQSIADHVQEKPTEDNKLLFKGSSETFEEEQIGNRYSWLSQGNCGAGGDPCESFYEGETINDYFENDDEYLDEINIVPEDFEFEPDASYHVYDNRRKEIFSAKTESELIKNRMYRSNSYSKKPKPGGLPFSEALPSQNNFVSSNNGRKITLFNSSGFRPINQPINIDKISIKEKLDPHSKNKDFLKSTNTSTTTTTTTTADFLSPINESFNDDTHTTR